MARCSCGNAACSCVIKGKTGGGVTVTGSGSPERPYELELTGGGAPLEALEMVGSPTVTWTKSGAGTPEDHRRYIATAEVAMRELTDVSKTDVPITGDVVQWNGTQWVFAPPGATSVPVSGTWGTTPLDLYGSDSTKGREIYLDSNGQIRAKPIALNKPAAFTAATPGSSYPLGYSVMRVLGGDNGAGSGWPLPVGSLGYVETFRMLDTTNVVQVWRRDTGTAGTQAVWQRTYSAGSWQPWTWLAGSVPHYAAYKSAAQSMAVANTWYTATFENVETNEGGITYSGGVFTVPFPGKYEINFGAHIQGTTSTTTVSLGLLKNGVSIADYSQSAVGTNKSWLMNRVVKCAAGDTLYGRARASVAGANMYGASGTRYTYIDVTMVGG